MKILLWALAHFPQLTVWLIPSPSLVCWPTYVEIPFLQQHPMDFLAILSPHPLLREKQQGKNYQIDDWGKIQSYLEIVESLGWDEGNMHFFMTNNVDFMIVLFGKAIVSISIQIIHAKTCT